MIRKEIMIDGTPVPFKASASVPRMYRLKFQRDIFRDMDKLRQQLDGRDPQASDLPLEAQRAVFEVLDCPRRIGLTLGGGLVMSPSKSVTAIAGITARTEKKPQNKCARCRNAACLFRSETWISEPS